MANLLAMEWVWSHAYIAAWLVTVVVILQRIGRMPPEGKSINHERTGTEVVTYLGWALGFTPFVPHSIQAVAMLIAVTGLVFMHHMEEYRPASK